jgi:hypothetical protein
MLRTPCPTPSTGCPRTSAHARSEDVKGALTPRAVFLLYDAQTGEKAWESQVGTLFALPDRPEDRELPVVGAAYLLTGDVDTALGRWLDHQPSAR